jgi:DNA-binding protein YbaB
MKDMMGLMKQAQASLMKPEEKEILEDLIVTAHEDARKKAERVMEEKMKAVTAGLPLPPGMKLPF